LSRAATQDRKEKNMNYTVISVTEQTEYSDSWSKTAEVSILGEDGREGTVWLTIGISEAQQGSAVNAFQAEGIDDCPESWMCVKTFDGGCLDSWCSPAIYKGVENIQEMASKIIRDCDAAMKKLV
jgi:hypothetical protein